MDKHVREIKYVKVPIERDDILEAPKESFFEMVRKAQIAAFQDGIKANTIAINENMVKVEAFPFSGIGGTRPSFCPNHVLRYERIPDQGRAS